MADINNPPKGGIVDLVMSDFKFEDEPLFDVTDIIEEIKNPGEGTFEGGAPGYGRLIYYSSLFPKGSEAALDVVGYDRSMYELVKKASRSADNEKVKQAQEFLKSIGYYDDKIDGLKGDKTMGAANRYILNFAKEHSSSFLKDIGSGMYKSIFGGD